MTTWKQTIRVPEETRGWGENKRVLPAKKATIELTINVDAILQGMGCKAARSKGKRSSAMGGKVRAVVRNVYEETADS
jgi:hypothetical protein